MKSISHVHFGWLIRALNLQVSLLYIISACEIAINAIGIKHVLILNIYVL